MQVDPLKRKKRTLTSKDFNRRTRDENIQIAEERGRNESGNDEQENNVIKITALQIKKFKRRKNKWLRKTKKNR